METEETALRTKKLLLILNSLLLTFGSIGGPLILRLYFLRGGKRIWLSAFLESGGWPVILIPLLTAYFRRRKNQGSAAKKVLINLRIFTSFAVIGLLTGLDDYFYAYGVGFLPVSTTALIIATQLAFTAFFAFLVVRQRFTAFSVNAVVLLTMGAGVLAMHSRSDRPEGVSKKDYFVGFFMTLAASALYGFVLPLIELAYKIVGRKEITYTLVMEAQLVMSFFATLFCTAGMLVNQDFQAMGREAKTYELGEAMYYVVLVLSAVSWQCFFLGAVGVVFCASSLLSGIIIAVSLPMVEILGVVFYHESFKVEKAVSLVLCIWGFISYFYGEMKQEEEKKKKNRLSHGGDKTQMTELVVAP